MFGGYCYFNNAAIVAEDLVRRTGEPVAILDVDYHHGNGTQQIFYGRGDVLYVSLHGDPDRAYPYFAGFAEETGAGAGRGREPEPAPARPAARTRSTSRTWTEGSRRSTAFGGSVVVVSLGIDTYRLRPDLRPRAHDRGLPRGRAGGSPRSAVATVVLQEGGYYVPHLGENVRNWLLGLEGREADLRGSPPEGARSPRPMVPGPAALARSMPPRENSRRIVVPTVDEP